MQIFLTGATGFVGQALVVRLLACGHTITALSRHIVRAKQRFPQLNWVDSLNELASFDEIDAVINLAGEPIFHRAWTTKQKQRLIQSRVQLTKQLVEKINQSLTPPNVFISASASGVYADNGEVWITEETSLMGNHFTARLCREWEACALNAHTRVCLLRTAMVLGQSGGAFPHIARLYKWGLGGRIGSGKQYWSWISLQDMVEGILFLLHHKACHGVFNFSSPNPLTNRAFNQALSQHLHRKACVNAPIFALKCLLGERHQLLTQSLRMTPEKLLKAGFAFQYPDFYAFLPSLAPQK